MDKYYKAYDDRYRQFHSQTGKAWAGSKASVVLKDILGQYPTKSKILEIGCGEGQNAMFLKQQGFDVIASDVSYEAISWCKKLAKNNNIDSDMFFVLDILNNNFSQKFDIIYSVSTLHMLILENDRKKFWDFIYEHLKEGGIAVVTVMGDGVKETDDCDISKAFDVVEKRFFDSDTNTLTDTKVNVANTSNRIVNWDTLFNEINKSNLKVLKHYLSDKIVGFSSSMIVEVKRK